MDGLNTNQTNYTDPMKSLEASLHGLSQRNKAIASNIANANTKGYIRREVSFENALQQELRNDGLELEAQKTHEDHLNKDILNLKDTVSSDLDFYSQFNGINNVNIEKEMIDLTQTGLRFKAISTMSKRYFENMRGIIRG
jgi:flagellar basal-body rod protein FlgB